MEETYWSIEWSPEKSTQKNPFLGFRVGNDMGSVCRELTYLTWGLFQKTDLVKTQFVEKGR